MPTPLISLFYLKPLEDIFLVKSWTLIVWPR
jgi:hypothetical protein